MNTTLLTVNLETDQPELTAHLDPWYQKVQVLKEDKTSLAEHHIYGSSRLGIQRYITGQKAYDPVTPTVGSGSGAAQPLLQKRAWYSMWGNDLFAPITATGTAASDPLSTDNMGTTGIGIQPHILGNRHYELTNHLGNVMATILDRSTPRLNEAKTALVGYSADISSAQDYYPFGMLMPGRYISDNTPQCITTQQTTLVPRTVRVYIDLTPAPHLPFPGGPIIATPYPWGPIRDLPIEASFRQQQARFNHYLPAEEHPEGFAARALPGGGGYELDLSDEPSGLSLYLPFGIDTGGSQVLGFGVGMLPAGVRLEARVRHYADTSSEEYREPVRWRNVQAGEQVELRFGLPAGSAGKLVAELRFSAEGGAGKFGSGRRVEIRDPWIEKTEWSTESRLVTLCDEKDKYRYGFNGIEKTNEIAGAGNHYTALYGEYDTRTAIRWNRDPKSNPTTSPYSMFGGNPITNSDVLLDTPSHTPQKGECEGCSDNTLENGDYFSDVQHQSYSVTVSGVSQQEFENVRNTFIHDPGKITNNWWASYDLIDRDGSFGASRGDHVDIDIKGPDNGSVRIKDLRSGPTSFSANFQALDGHPDAGEIWFSGKYNKNDHTFTFNVFNITRTDVNLDAAGGNSFARFAQQRQWKTVLSNVPRFMNKIVQSASMNITEYDYNDWTNKQGQKEWSRSENITNFVKQKATE